MAFPALPGADLVSWSQRPDTRHLLNLKSCELQLAAADALLDDAVSQLDPADVRQYPIQTDLLESLADAWDVPAASIMLTAGSNAAIATIVDALAAPAGRLVVQEPAFESWVHFAALRGLQVERCRGIDGDIPITTIAAFEAALRRGPQAVAAITNPGNPLGDFIPIETMHRLADIAAVSGHVLVIDECYAAFAETDHRSLQMRHPNVLVVRSLSKSWGLAGARLSATFGSPELLKRLQCLRIDTAVAATTLRIALHLSHRLDDLEALWQTVREIREWFTAEVLHTRPDWLALRSTTNFVTFRTSRPGGGAVAAKALAANGIRVRSLEDVGGLHGCVRIAIADRTAMQRVLAVLHDLEGAITATARGGESS